MSENNFSISKEIKSGLIVFLVALPLCLGISLASGAPLISGVIAGIIGGVVVGFLSDSHVSVSGPAAGLAAVVLASIQELGSFDVFLMAVVIAGALQIIFGFLNAGLIAHFIPTSVIEGMMSAIGVILIIKQFPIAMGVKGKLLEFNFIYSVLILSLCCFVLNIIFTTTKIKDAKIFKIIPFSLVLVIFAVLYGVLLKDTSLALDSINYVQLGGISEGASMSSVLTFPNWSGFNFYILKHSLVIAIIASLETLLCIEASDKMDPLKRVTSTSRELKAQGIGNLLSGLIGGLPITSVVVRTTVNISSGAQTKFSAVFHGLFLFAGVMLFPNLIQKIPLAALAVILILSGYKLAHPTKLKKMFKKGWKQAVPFFVTILAILFTDLLMGVLIGILVSSFIIMKVNYSIQDFRLNNVDHNQDQIEVIFSDYVSYLSKASLKKFLNKIPEGKKVLLNFKNSIEIDDDVKDILDEFKLSAKLKNILVTEENLGARK